VTNEAARNAAVACNVAAVNELDDKIWGHISVRDEDGRGVWMKRSGIGFEEVTPHDVQLVSWDGEVLHGHGKRHSEWPIHTEIMLARPDVGSVLHAHPENATALGASGMPLRPVSHEACLFGGEISRFDEVTSLIINRDLGRKVAHSLGPDTGLLLVNHGIVTAATDYKTATFAGITLEVAARKQRYTVGMGGLPEWTDPDEVRLKQEQIYHPDAIDAVWDYLVRRLDPAL